MRYKMWLEVETQVLFFLSVPGYFENKVLLLPCFKLKMDFKKQYGSHNVLLPEMDVVVCSNMWELEKGEGFGVKMSKHAEPVLWGCCACSQALAHTPCLRSQGSKSTAGIPASLPPPSLLLYFSPSPMSLCTSFNCMCLFELLYI